MVQDRMKICMRKSPVINQLSTVVRCFLFRHSGSQVLVIRTPKGIYIRTMDGKIFAVRTASQMAAAGISPEEMNALNQPPTTTTTVATSASSSSSHAATSTSTATTENAATSAGHADDDAEDEEGGAEDGGESARAADAERSREVGDGDDQEDATERDTADEAGEGTEERDNGQNGPQEEHDEPTHGEGHEENKETNSSGATSSMPSKPASKMASLTSLTSEEAMSIAKALTDVTKTDFITPSSSSATISHVFRQNGAGFTSKRADKKGAGVQ